MRAASRRAMHLKRAPERPTWSLPTPWIRAMPRTRRARAAIGGHVGSVVWALTPCDRSWLCNPIAIGHAPYRLKSTARHPFLTCRPPVIRHKCTLAGMQLCAASYLGARSDYDFRLVGTVHVCFCSVQTAKPRRCLVDWSLWCDCIRFLLSGRAEQQPEQLADWSRYLDWTHCRSCGKRTCLRYSPSLDQCIDANSRRNQRGQGASSTS
jgi:hypothetical protein